MNAGTLRHDWLGGLGRMGLLGILMTLGLGCGSNPPATQEPAPEPEPGAAASEPVQEPAPEPAPSTAPDSAGAIENAPAGEPEPARVPPQPTAQGEDEGDRVEPAAEPTGKVAQLIEESDEAARKGLYGQARRLCSRALEIEPGQPRAVIVCAISACNLGNERLARRYYALAENEHQQKQIFQICHSRGIDLRK